MLNSFRSCFKTFFICTFNASKVAFIHFYFNGGLHPVSIGKPSERMSLLSYCHVKPDHKMWNLQCPKKYTLNNIWHACKSILYVHRILYYHSTFGVFILILRFTNDVNDNNNNNNINLRFKLLAFSLALPQYIPWASVCMT